MSAFLNWVILLSVFHPYWKQLETSGDVLGCKRLNLGSSGGVYEGGGI